MAGISGTMILEERKELMLLEAASICCTWTARSQAVCPHVLGETWPQPDANGLTGMGSEGPRTVSLSCGQAPGHSNQLQGCPGIVLHAGAKAAVILGTSNQ